MEHAFSFILILILIPIRILASELMLRSYTDDELNLELGY